MMLSDVCLSVAYIRHKSRTERPRKTEIGTEVANVTHDWDTTFKVKVTGRFTHHDVNASGSCSSEHGNILSLGTYCYVALCTLQVWSAWWCEALRHPQRKERGGGILWRPPPTACSDWVGYVNVMLITGRKDAT